MIKKIVWTTYVETDNTIFQLKHRITNHEKTAREEIAGKSQHPYLLSGQFILSEILILILLLAFSSIPSFAFDYQIYARIY